VATGVANKSTLDYIPDVTENKKTLQSARFSGI
jgi:hypothetical protein